ncbi:MAG TPA: hypothetical protein VD905_10570, partial [Flavobacteriales bacterium]|nr:hypothetical protein [Flavobacteriales bacterium]
MSQTLIFFLFIIGMFLAARLTNALADEGAKSIYGICAGTVYALLFFCTPFDIPMPPAPEEKHACGLAVL